MAFLKGHLVSKKTRKKLSLIHKGKIRSKIWRKNLSLAMQGKKHTRETIEKMIKSNTKHGEAKIGKRSIEYRTWDAIKTRCYNPKAIQFKDYGGRGIKMSDEWKNNYVSFLKDIGRRPSEKYSIERIDNNKGYCKENCKWILKKE
jgi:hypothetical protein